jgi:hypothetical protein
MRVLKRAVPQESSSANKVGARARMAGEQTPFDSIDGALEYVGLLREAIDKAKGDVAAECERAAREGAKRKLEALRLAAYKLDRLARHMQCGHRQLNDLRTIRRLLRGERRETPGASVIPARCR